MAPGGSRDGFAAAPAGGVEQVLVVDDSPAIQRTVEAALNQLGVSDERVTVLGSGDDALAYFGPLDPDLVLLDTSMPGIDPYDVVQAMLLEDPEARIVALTEKPTDDPAVAELLSFGAFDILRKPIRAEDLEQLLRSIEEERPGAGRIP